MHAGAISAHCAAADAKQSVACSVCDMVASMAQQCLAVHHKVTLHDVLDARLQVIMIPFVYFKYDGEINGTGGGRGRIFLPFAVGVAIWLLFALLPLRALLNETIAKREEKRARRPKCVSVQKKPALLYLSTSCLPSSNITKVQELLFVRMLAS